MRQLKYLLLVIGFFSQMRGNSGNNELIKHSFSNKINLQDLLADDYLAHTKWKGKYYFEAHNRDNYLTSFEISIQDLNNIEVKYISDGNTPEIYKNLKGEVLSANKIRIVFNKNYDDMGEIILEKDPDGYYISGQPIYFINPGNDRFLIEKIKEY
jgi:hypothetical protein